MNAKKINLINLLTFVKSFVYLHKLLTIKKIINEQRS
jgi:hypothetical protein